MYLSPNGSKFKLNCCLCGAEVERSIDVKKAVCFNCKKKRKSDDARVKWQKQKAAKLSTDSKGLTPPS